MSKRYKVEIVRDLRPTTDPDRRPYAVVDLTEKYADTRIVERFSDRITADVECARMNRENP